MTKADWVQQINNLKKAGKSVQEINKIVGQYEGPEGVFTVQQAASSKAGFVIVDKNKRGARNAKRQLMERRQSLGIGETEMPRNTTNPVKREEFGAGPGKELHHRNSLQQFNPFYEGLDETQSQELTSWFRELGYDMGNQDPNTDIPADKPKHKQTHARYRERGIEGTKFQASIADKVRDMPLEDRKMAIRYFMDYGQGIADEAMEEVLGSEIWRSPRHDAAQAANRAELKASEIPSGPRAGERLPNNRRTIGDRIIRELQTAGARAKLPDPKAGLRRAAIMTPLLGAGSIFLSQQEAQSRGQAYKANPTPLNKFQQELAEFGAGADAAAIAFPPAELGGTAAGLLNTAIDNRSQIKTAAKVTKKGADFFRDEIVGQHANLGRALLQIGQQWWNNRNK